MCMALAGVFAGHHAEGREDLFSLSQGTARLAELPHPGRPQSCFTSCPFRTQLAVAKVTRAHRAHSHGEPPLSCASMPMGSTRPTAAAQGTQAPPRPRRSRAASARAAPRPMTQRASPMCRASAVLIRPRCPVSR